MVFVTGEVVPSPKGLQPYKVIFKRKGVVLSEWPVESIAEGEAQIVAALRGLGKGIIGKNLS